MMRIRSVRLKFVFETCLVLGALLGLITTVVEYVAEPSSRKTLGLDLLIGIPLDAFVLGVSGVLLAWIYNRVGVRWGGGFVIELEPVDAPYAATPKNHGAAVQPPE